MELLFLFILSCILICFGNRPVDGFNAGIFQFLFGESNFITCFHFFFNLIFSVSKLFIPYQLKKSRLKPKIKIIKTTMNSFTEELEQYQAELREVEKYTKIEEYLKVLGLTLEVCIFPTRFHTQV